MENLIPNKPAPAPAPAAGGTIKDTNAQGFVADVIEASMKVPVIVDFWAPWCGPCKQLTPVLEKLVAAANGTVRLVKLNVDENQEVAAQMRIQSIPAVFAFKDGKPVDGFMGALPEGQVKQFIDRLTDGAASAELDGFLEAGVSALEAGDPVAAARSFAEALKKDRENAPAIAGLARCHLMNNDLDGAEKALALAPPALAADPAIAGARAALELARNPVEEGAVAEGFDRIQANPKDHAGRLALAVALNAAERREEALDHLIEIIIADRDWDDQAARKQLLQFFEAWGPTDPLTVQGRRRLSTILFS